MRKLYNNIKMKHWTLDDLNNLISNEIEENKTLEYKSAEGLGKNDSKKNEISKDVSAFANSNGGTLIYGIKEYDDPSKSHKPERIDPVNRIDFSKEWLEQIINSRVQPKIEGLDVQCVDFSKEDNTVVYFIEIPKSTTAHMAASNKYYKRYNFKSEAMEDYEVKDVMNRSKYPRIELEFMIENIIQKHPVNQAPMIGILSNEIKYEKKISNRLKISAINKGVVFANYVNFIVKVNKNFLDVNEVESLEEIIEDNSGRKYIELYGENTVRDLLEVELSNPLTGSIKEKRGPSRFDPILPGRKSKAEIFKVIEEFQLFNEETISWQVFADNSIPISGEIKISDIEVKTIE